MELGETCAINISLLWSEGLLFIRSLDMNPRFFKTGSAFRKWLAANHAKAKELWVGFYKKSSGKPSITWPESVDEALCFGWIDGIRKRIDDVSYKIRFTPRRASSNWSLVNVKRVGELKKAGRMRPAGLRAFEESKEARTGVYSYEQRITKLDAACEKVFKANRKAWEFFQSQPPYYRKMVSWYVMSAKKDETRLKRLNTLIDESAHARRIDLVPPAKGKS